MNQKWERQRLRVKGMDCAECALHTEEAVRAVPGVREARVYLGSERLDVVYDPDLADTDQIVQAVAQTGYRVEAESDRPGQDQGTELTQRLTGLFLAVVVLVILVEAVGEQLGFLEAVLTRIPPWLAIAAILAGGYPIFRSVLQALYRGRVTAHALMTLGIIGALSIGEYTAAVVIVFFMRVSDYLEGLTTDRSRQAIRALMRLAPETAHRLRDDKEEEVPIDELRPGDWVVVRPGEQVPADGTVEKGTAAVDQAPITGESMPVDKEPGSAVFAGTIVHGGALTVQVRRSGADSTLGRVIQLVEEAEANKAPVQRMADRFTAWYIPVVVAAATLTYVLGRSVTAAIAVLLVSCACAIALATPTAVIAAVGQAAARGILIKGGRYLELMARVDTVVMDKTGTLTFGRPTVTDVAALDGRTADEVVQLAAAAEQLSEHPVAAAVRQAARQAKLDPAPTDRFEALAGMGVRARSNGSLLLLGSRRLLEAEDIPLPAQAVDQAASWQADGKSTFFVAVDHGVVGLLAVADEPRPEVPEALAALREQGIERLLLLTGDNQRTAQVEAERLGIDYRAELLPAEKIAVVKELQNRGHTVLMVGDGVNDAPALAQADVGVAMGVAGTDAALEAADVALMRDDWRALPEAVHVGRRTFRVIQQNLGLGVVYNLLGITLAAVGILPPVAAAAGQSIPDLLIMLSSARLLRR
ncbi:MAG: heavy metal translocating P-type ATPase [Chloroflexota bacterium]